jgi:pre-rRNA-processing protein TSR1
MDIKKEYTDWFKFHFPEDEKSFFLDEQLEIAKLFRHVANHVPRYIHWRENRSYMLVDHTEFVESVGNESTGTLKLTGYIRGRALNANQLVYLQEIGQFQIEKIVSAVDTYESTLKVRKYGIHDVIMKGEDILSISDQSQVKKNHDD